MVNRKKSIYYNQDIKWEKTKTVVEIGFNSDFSHRLLFNNQKMTSRLLKMICTKT